VLVPARTAAASFDVVRSAVVRNWVTGTIGTAASRGGVAVGGVVGSGDADAAGVAAGPPVGDEDGSVTTPAPLGAGEAPGDVAASPTEIATVTASNARTVTRGSRFTGGNCASG